MPDFGGASVTIPHKTDIIKELDELSPAARLIGAVNTIIPMHLEGGTTRLVGDNTDWIGIRNTILSKSSDNWSPNDSGLVIGAGGTARAAVYALHSLGLGTIYILNRTKSNAEQLMNNFPREYGIIVLPSSAMLEKTPPGIVVGTVPSAATIEGELKLEDAIFCRFGGGIVVEMAYLPKTTPLVELATKISVESSQSEWNVVYGVEVLLEQGYEQFRLWTTHRPPHRAIKEKVIQMYGAV
jgi:pentafunctional AROM polypeptide